MAALRYGLSVELGLVVLVLGASPSVASAKRAEPDCRVVKVVDGKGRPIAGAEVTIFPCGYEAMMCDGQVWETDRRGRVCGEELLGGEGSLEIIAPDRLGGRCAASKTWLYPKEVPEGAGTAPIVVRLDMRPVARAPLK